MDKSCGEEEREGGRREGRGAKGGKLKIEVRIKVMLLGTRKYSETPLWCILN